MNVSSVVRPEIANWDANLTRFFKVALALSLALLVAYLAQANNGGAGNALQEFNTWMESELGGSIGTAIGLVSFLIGLVSAIATRGFMPLLWGIGIGLLLGVFLNIVTTATSFGMPVVVAAAGG